MTRSVANHLNDISKKDSALVVETLSRWREMELQNEEELDWITRHALRTLVKKGNTAALALLGYRDQPDIRVSDFGISPSVWIGDTGTFSFNITANRDENLMVDYVMHFVKANGTTAPKVFKLKKLILKKGQTVMVQKAHRFVKGATTFTHYAGAHRIVLQINGQNFGDAGFALI